MFTLQISWTYSSIRTNYIFRHGPTTVRSEYMDMGFIGRNGILNEMIEKIDDNEDKPLALVGLDGMGKTWLIRRYCHLEKSKYPEKKFYWIDMKDEDTKKEKFTEIAKELKLKTLEVELNVIIQ